MGIRQNFMNLSKQIKSYIKTNQLSLLLLVCIIVLILIGLYCWLYTSKASEFGLNFFTEMSGVLITIFIVDRIIDFKEQKKNIPLRIVIYKDLSLIYNRLVNLYYELYDNSCPEPIEPGFLNFVKSGALGRALLYTDINKAANVYPEISLVTHLVNQSKDLQKRSETLIDKYALFMDPYVLGVVHELFLEFSPISSMIYLPSIIKARAGMPYPSSLLYHASHPNEEQINRILAFESWLDNERSRLLRYDDKIRHVSKGEHLVSGKRNIKTTYSYRINELVLREQEAAYLAWRNAQSPKS